MSPALQATPKTNDLSKRRRFQPPITTFFPNASESTSACDPHTSHNHYSARTYSPTPTVPAAVQSSLLSVGMRVRKSVAEGYRTNGGSSKLDAKTTFPSYNPTALHRNAGAPTTELSPFCNMSHAGDAVTQAHHSTPALGMDFDPTNNQLITDDGDAFSLPPSSQESAASYARQPTAQKRTLDADCEDDWVYDSDRSIPFTPSTVTPYAGRTILAPKLGQQRRRFVAMQEQRTMDLDDFDEALFLRRREEVDMEYIPGGESGYEVQMGGL